MTDPDRDTVAVSGELLLDAVLDAAASLIVVVDTDGRVVRWNRACERVSGYTAGEMTEAESILKLIPEEEQERATRLVEPLARGESPVRTEVQWRTRSGELRLISWSTTALTGPDGEVTHIVGTGIDVTDERELQVRLRHLADHDGLTGLVNRRRFEAELERHLAYCRRYGHTGALLVLDLDGFKEVNDNHGHKAGDGVLVGVAGALRRRLRETDVIARLGGDEFAVLLPRGTADDALLVCRSLELAIPDEVPAPGGRSIEVSIGYAAFHRDVESIDDVMSAADASMYADKSGQPR